MAAQNRLIQIDFSPLLQPFQEGCFGFCVQLRMQFQKAHVFPADENVDTKLSAAGQVKGSSLRKTAIPLGSEGIWPNDISPEVSFRWGARV
ncbi:hypothetical protein [Roseibium sp. RKSG952]|uniref:hypothetical protein n=1 Tax=Roseibium sp. RKSG952 TaxID=2529384 RepID=UPI0018AD21F2|nr:hypothetical protein [Roseibium sp. RKSG952]